MSLDMKNPIVVRILDLTDGKYDFDETDIAEINRAKDPQLVADCLLDRINDYANDIANDPELEFHFDPGLVPTDMLIRAVDLSRPIRAYATGADYLWKRLGRKNMMRLFEAILEDQGTRLTETDGTRFGNWLLYTFLSVLDRDPDAEAVEFYSAARAAGSRLSVISADIENSDEALALGYGA